MMCSGYVTVETKPQQIYSFCRINNDSTVEIVLTVFQAANG